MDARTMPALDDRQLKNIHWRFNMLGVQKKG